MKWGGEIEWVSCWGIHLNGLQAMKWFQAMPYDLNQRHSSIKLPLFYCHMPRVEGTQRSLTPSFCLHQDLMESSRAQNHKWWSWLSISSYRLQIQVFLTDTHDCNGLHFLKNHLYNWRSSCFAHFKCIIVRSFHWHLLFSFHRYITWYLLHVRFELRHDL